MRRASGDTLTTERGGAMRRSTEIEVTREAPRDYEVLRSMLHTRPSQLVRMAFPEAVQDSESIAVLRLPRAPRIGVRAVVEFRSPDSSDDGAVIALTWRARHLASAFPVMHAVVHLHPVGPERTEMTLKGHYVVPLGLLGLVGDQLIGAAGARATARRFLDDLVGALETP